MAFVQTLGSLELVEPYWTPGIIRSTIRMYDQYSYDYATMYRTQPNVRTCVDFLARNIAQLGLHLFKRISDVDRVRITDNGIAQIIKMPLPAKYKVTEYRFKEAIVSDLGIYFNSYLLKIRKDNQLSLLRIPPENVVPKGGLLPSYYEITINGQMREFPPEDIIHFRGYNPENAIYGLSPLETLRRVLAEEYSMGQYREGFWQNSARMSGIVKRPSSAPEWSDDAREAFKQQFAELYSGPANSGKTAVLEEDMEWTPVTFSARESEYLGGRKLTREECARAYHIPLPMVGILDNATFSNITEQHKNLYQDTLGPWLASIEQDFELQLFPEFNDTENLYLEFNINEKLQGSFEEQTKALQSSVGRPWMTADEARAKMNLPSIGGDADRLVTPLNVIVGGQASLTDMSQRNQKLLTKQLFNSYFPEMRQNYQEKWTRELAKHYRRQESYVLSNMPKMLQKVDIGGVWWDSERWDRELEDDLLKLNLATAAAWANLIAGLIDSDVSENAMIPYLTEHTRIQAENINNFTRDNVEVALMEPDPTLAIKDLFLQATTTWATREAVTAVTSMSSFGTHEAARAGGLKNKTWHVNSKNPRDSHAALNGETVGIGDSFSNGMRWPGDPAGGADEVANCQCSVSFNR